MVPPASQDLEILASSKFNEIEIIESFSIGKNILCFQGHPERTEGEEQDLLSEFILRFFGLWKSSSRDISQDLEVLSNNQQQQETFHVIIQDNYEENNKKIPQFQDWLNNNKKFENTKITYTI